LSQGGRRSPPHPRPIPAPSPARTGRSPPTWRATPGGLSRRRKVAIVSIMSAGFLFCSDPLRPRRVDPHFEPQAAAVRDLDGRSALIGHGAGAAGGGRGAVARVPEGFGPAWYRGWMLPAERYRRLAEALSEKGGRLITDAGAYRSGHELPGWLGSFRDLT